MVLGGTDDRAMGGSRILQMPSPVTAYTAQSYLFSKMTRLPDARRLARRDRATVGKALFEVLVAARVSTAERVDLQKKYDSP